eukprot:3353653-Rhodomonas_salina.2
MACKCGPRVPWLEHARTFFDINVVQIADLRAVASFAAVRMSCGSVAWACSHLFLEKFLLVATRNRNSWEFVGIRRNSNPAAVNCDCTEIPCTTSVPMQYCGVPRFEKWVKSIGEMKYTFLDLLLMQTNTNSMLPSTETSTPNKISQSIGCPD